jgi:serine/threonine-protein kinase
MSEGWADVGCSLAGDRYILLAPLGTGGMSVVWRAMDTVLDREVAIKVLNSDTALASDQAEQLKTEAQAIARLKHRHVTSVHDLGQDVADDGTLRHFVVMELITGPTLQDLLAGGKTMPWPLATTVAAQVASALAYAHERGIVHRDISCANIILTDDGVKVLDFGIAALMGQPDSGDDEILLGTPAYIAPERLRPSETPVAAAADVYGLGVVWYQMLAGEMPWTARTSTGLIQAHLVYMPAPLPPIEGLPERLRELCMACLAKNPLDRPTSQELAAELARYRDEPFTATEPIAAVAQKPRPNRVLIAAAAAAVVLTGAMAHSWLPRPQSPSPQAIATPTEITSTPSEPVIVSPTAEPSGSPGKVTRPAAAAGVAPDTNPGTTVRAEGGTVRVTCTGNKAQVVNVTTAPGYTVKELKAGPGAEVHIVLKAPQNESDIKVTCAGGVAAPEVKERPKPAAP